MDDDDDPVVDQLNVELTQELASKLHVLQCPLEPKGRPRMLQNVAASRHRPVQKALQMDTKLDPTSATFDEGAQFALEMRTHVSTLVPAQTNYVIGVVHGRQLHLTPINGVLQMRPSLAHVDECDRQIAVDEAEKAAARKEKFLSSGKHNRAQVLDDDENDADEPKIVEVQFRRAETEKMVERKNRSYQTLQESREREDWKALEYFDRITHESKIKREELCCTTKAQVPLTATREDYLSRLSCARGTRAAALGLHAPIPVVRRSAHEAVRAGSQPRVRALYARRTSRRPLTVPVSLRRSSERWSRRSASKPLCAIHTSCPLAVCANLPPRSIPSRPSRR